MSEAHSSSQWANRSPATRLWQSPSQPLFQSPAEPVSRWLVLLGGLTLVGSVTFHLLVSRPVLKADDGEGERAPLNPPLTGSLARLVIIATAVLLAASVAQLIVQASVVFESSLAAVFGGPVWEVLFDTEWGRLWLWRIALGNGLRCGSDRRMAQGRQPGAGGTQRRVGSRLSAGN